MLFNSKLLLKLFVRKTYQKHFFHSICENELKVCLKNMDTKIVKSEKKPSRVMDFFTELQITVLRLGTLIDVWQKWDFFSAVKYA